MTFSNPDEQAVWERVQAMNRAWSGGHPERLVDYFHQDMVAITPVDAERMESGAACVAGWTDYASFATIHRWEERNPLVRLHGNAAVVAYDYEVDAEAGGHRQLIQGRDLLFLVFHEGRWQVVADQFSPMPQAAGANKE